MGCSMPHGLRDENLRLFASSLLVGDGSGSRCSARPLVGNSWFVRHPSDFAGRHVVELGPLPRRPVRGLHPLTEAERRRRCVQTGLRPRAGKHVRRLGHPCAGFLA